MSTQGLIPSRLGLRCEGMLLVRVDVFLGDQVYCRLLDE